MRNQAGLRNSFTYKCDMGTGQYREGNKRQTLHPIEAAGHIPGMPKAITGMGTRPACHSQQLSLENSHTAAGLQLYVVSKMGHLQNHTVM